MTRRLTTRSEYDQCSPELQGFLQYWEGSQPGSELKDLANPYPKGQQDHSDWTTGQIRAAIEAQEGDD